MVVQWKQRLYAFLLKRILGPYLSPSSLQKLHQTIEVSFQDGKFALMDVELNALYLTSKILNGTGSSTDEDNDTSAPSRPIAIRYARIRRLGINLSLHEISSGPASTNGSKSSIAWKALQLGRRSSSIDESSSSSPTTTPRVSLIAHVEIDGMELEIEPIDPGQMSLYANYASNPVPPPESTSTGSGYVSSYVDSVLSSLKLSVQMSDLSVRFSSTTAKVKKPTTSKQMVELRLATAYYHDVDISKTASAAGATTQGDSKYETVLHKAIDFAGIVVQTGEVETTEGDIISDGALKEKNQKVNTTILGRSEGTGQIMFRAIAYSNVTNIGSKKGNNETDAQRIQQDIEVSLNQRLNMSVDEQVLRRILAVVRSFEALPPKTNESKDAHAMWQEQVLQPQLTQINEDETIDQEDIRVVQGMMKQYYEARQLAETQQMKGGVLVPSDAYEDAKDADPNDDEPVTFDAFFDANDQSFHHYSSVLGESLRASKSEGGVDNFVHTKLKFFLLSSGVKVCFPRRQPNIKEVDVNYRQADEYLLLTIDDVNASAALSQSTSELTVSVSHVEIEDALSEVMSGRERADIGSVVRFKEIEMNDDSAIVSEAPCISINVSSRRSGEVTQDCDVAIMLEPFDVFCRQGTVRNCIALMGHIQEKNSVSIDYAIRNLKTVDQAVPEKIKTHIGVGCPSITVTIPIDDAIDVEKRDDRKLFGRCGYTLRGGVIAPKSSLGLVIDEVSIDIDKRPSENEELGSFCCDHVVLFATCPSGGSASGIKRMDILACSGRVEVEPHVPISIRYRNLVPESQEQKKHGRNAFPTVPSLSAFKARQEDEEERKEDAFWSAKMNELDSISNLRGSDPQKAMLSEAEKCDVIFEVNIPDLVGDLSRDEALVLSEMISSINFNSFSQNETKKPSKRSNELETRKRIGVALKLDQFCVCAHHVLDAGKHTSNMDWYSYILSGEMFRSHAVIDSELRSLRILAHELNFFEARKFVYPRFADDVYLKSTTHERYNSVRNRNIRNPSSSANPIFHRSHMFTPISPESPSILIDVLSPNTEKSFQRENFSELNVHVTVYNMTHRYEVDSSWIERLLVLFQGRQKCTAVASESNDRITLTHQQIPTSLTRLFISMIDCNLDYMPPAEFKSASRLIVRIGDFRLSSNVLSPAGDIQSFRCSVNDLSVHLTNFRCPHNKENSRLAFAATIMSPNDMAPKEQLSTRQGSAPETVLQSMDFVTMLTLDSLDALISTANTAGLSSNIEPNMTVNMSLGSLYLYSCKDSFACLSDTIGELQLQLTALDEEGVKTLQSKSVSQARSFQTAPSVDNATEEFFESVSGFHDCFEFEPSSEDLARLENLDILSPPLAGLPLDDPIVDRNTATNHILESSIPTVLRSYEELDDSVGEEFLLDGYDWTTIDHELEENPDLQAGEEQSAKWYSKELNIFQQHIPMNPVTDPLSEGDMNANRFAGTNTPPPVQTRVIIRDLSVRCRFFDGYDWPKCKLRQGYRAPKDARFIIEHDVQEDDKQMESKSVKSNTAAQSSRKAQLMGDLLGDNDDDENDNITFGNVPLPEERGSIIENSAEVRRLARRTNRFFQVSLSGLKLRLDTFDDTPDHRLASCMDVSMADMFLAETVSNSKPIKMLGEWFNDIEHPRDSKDGLVTLKMVTWHPSERVSKDNEIINDESLGKLELLPLRCYVDQRTVRFISTFFSGEESTEECSSVVEPQSQLKPVPPPMFRSFKVKSAKLKVNYRPEKLDVDAIRDGCYVELINLNPLEGMVIVLQPVSVDMSIGFGAVVSALLKSWIADICATQLYKFVTDAAPFKPLTQVGGGFADLVVLPWAAFKEKGDARSVKKAMRSSARSLAGTVVYETLTTSSKLTQYAAEKLMGVLSSPSRYAASAPLPSRPRDTPRGLQQVTGHAVDSVAHGLSTANYKVIIIPCREYCKTGAMGATKSVVRGIPVAVMAPFGGVAEAVSYTLLGVRNQVRPDIRKEEEASQRGLHHGDF